MSKADSQEPSRGPEGSPVLQGRPTAAHQLKTDLTGGAPAPTSRAGGRRNGRRDRQRQTTRTGSEGSPELPTDPTRPLGPPLGPAPQGLDPRDLPQLGRRDEILPAAGSPTLSSSRIHRSSSCLRARPN
ncbi:hypothetical protein GCM10020219_027620 [Nonomuraea dietziae]